MKIVFTQHALEKLAERVISKEMVRRTVDAPIRLIAAGEKFHAFGKFGKRYLKVIFVRADDSLVIITQHFIDSPL